jgi:hypothetical protein
MCIDNLALLLKVCADLGVPLALDKQEGPSIPILIIIIIIEGNSYSQQRLR